MRILLKNTVTELSSAQITAADINGDGKVNVADSKLILYHRAEVAGYSLDFKKYYTNVNLKNIRS